MHSPLDILLEYLEDNILGQKIAETEEEEWLELAHELQGLVPINSSSALRGEWS
jgi:hypothetical protein